MTGANLRQKQRDTAHPLFGGWARLRAQVERLTRRLDGEDLLHDAYVRMAELDTPPRDDRAFLISAAVNRGRDAYRREVVRGERDDRLGIEALYDPAPIQDEALIACARLARVSEGIAQLSPRTREVFLLQRLEGCKYREIAERLQISQSAVEKHMAKAMAFLTDWTEDW